MGMKALLCSIFVLVCLGTVRAQTTVYLVRHGEKDRSNPKNRDPSLTKAGKVRAQALADTLRSVKLTAIYVTDYKRTRNTAAPVAKQGGLTPRVPEPGQPSKLVGHLRDDHKGGDVLVVGHSNTLPAILRELGIKKRFGIALDEYDNLFVVRIAKDGKATILHLHYGKRDAPKKKD
ncbi:MAG: hypothetical protein CMJ85_13900 [Planctomycetes bacterium]|jgi:phosphohistidine phosphatase SixA|nr:hypothetical protein [Planctomycetota bacterium]